ncbi:MAG: multidrug efflux SMR transporter [Anaerolineae bacterium]|nr:multidrug efflux SMR transporter [Anaerolineae bacterium]
MNLSPFTTLMIAIAAEIIGTTALKLSQGFTRPLFGAVMIICYIVTFYFLSLTLKNMSVGTAYAIWAGLGTAGVVILGILIFREPVDLARILGIVLIVAGVVVLNLFSGGTAHA